LLLSMSVKFNWSINAFEVTGAFVHSPIDETIYGSIRSIVHKIVGIKLEQDNDQILLSQHLLLNQLLHKHDQEFNQTHIATYTPLIDSNLTTLSVPPLNMTLFQSYIGFLNYLALAPKNYASVVERKTVS
ncbi:uncharacterized protein VP01_11837g1, partial [Puccinia sorghi]